VVQDADLDAISEGVGKLKAIAIDIGQEIDTQNKMIEELTDKVDNVTGHVISLNSKLKRQLDGVRGRPATHSHMRPPAWLMPVRVSRS
jgi:archaellum component FlaC